MNTQEATMLIAETRKVYPAMTIVVGMVDTWQGLLGDLRFDELCAALADHGRAESRIPAPADLRRRAIAARQDAAMRALPGGTNDRVPMLDWFHTTVRYHAEQVREANRERRDRGEPAYYGETVMRPSDGRP